MMPVTRFQTSWARCCRDESSGRSKGRPSQLSFFACSPSLTRSSLAFEIPAGLWITSEPKGFLA
jgi:hypothetical protein